MGEGYEVLLWLAVMGFIGIRSAMQRSRSQKPSPGDDEAGSVERTRSSRPGREVSTKETSRRQAMLSRQRVEASGPPARRGSGLLSRWTEFAADLERQMGEQQEAKARTNLPEEEKTVVVPGRRVYPSTPASATPTRVRAEDSHWDDWETESDSHALHESRGSDPRDRALHAPAPREAREARHSTVQTVERIHRPGLARLESFGTLKRAVILADVLGPPPGLDGSSPAERRLDRLL